MGGIDGVFEKDGKLYIVETKYGTGAFDTLAGCTRQMDKNWIADRINDLPVPEATKQKLMDGEYTSVLAKVSPAGEVRYSKLNDTGYVVLGKAGRLEF